jgi:P-type E1-E2 ATPase
VIATGFTTRRGKIQKKIMHRIAQQPDFFKQAVWFLAFSGSLSVVVFFSTLKMKLDADIDRSLVWLGLINVVLNAIFPALPIYFTMAYSWAIYRLKKDNILTTMPEKTVESNRLKISCFDKTGTLTENSISLDKVYLHEMKFREIEKVNKQSAVYHIAQMLLGTCHSVRKIGDDHLGD